MSHVVCYKMSIADFQAFRIKLKERGCIIEEWMMSSEDRIRTRYGQEIPTASGADNHRLSFHDAVGICSYFPQSNEAILKIDAFPCGAQFDRNVMEAFCGYGLEKQDIQIAAIEKEMKDFLSELRSDLKDMLDKLPGLDIMTPKAMCTDPDKQTVAVYWMGNGDESHPVDVGLDLSVIIPETAFQALSGKEKEKLMAAWHRAIGSGDNAPMGLVGRLEENDIVIRELGSWVRGRSSSAGNARRVANGNAQENG